MKNQSFLEIAPFPFFSEMSQINKYHSLILKSKTAPDLFVEIAGLPATSIQETGLKDHSVFKYRLWYLSQSEANISVSI